MESSGSDDSLTSFSLLRLPQASASMVQGWTDSAIESWIEDTIQHISRRASEAGILSTPLEQDAAIAAICDRYMCIDLASDFTGVEDSKLDAAIHQIQGTSMSNCRRCIPDKHGVDKMAASFSEGNLSSSPGAFLRGAHSKATYTSPGSGPAKCTEDEIMDVAAKRQCMGSPDSSHLQVRLATQALSQLVESGWS